jgi:molybdate transport system substrate-binding protein
MKWFLVCLALLLTPAGLNAEDQRERLTVFAAASLTDVLEEHAEAWAKNTGNLVPRLSFGASATMARQIEAGAPADIFISANTIFTEQLIRKNLATSAYNLISNALVVVAPAGTIDTPITNSEALESFLAGQRVAIANPAISPAGVYTTAFLSKTGLWNTLSPQATYVQNVRQALRLAETAGIPAIIYKSDAATSEKVDVVFEIPMSASGLITYSGIAIKTANPQNNEFLLHLQSTQAQTIWGKHGFVKIASN